MSYVRRIWVIEEGKLAFWDFGPNGVNTRWGPRSYFDSPDDLGGGMKSDCLAVEVIDTLNDTGVVPVSITTAAVTEARLDWMADRIYELERELEWLRDD